MNFLLDVRGNLTANARFIACLFSGLWDLQVCTVYRNLSQNATRDSSFLWITIIILDRLIAYGQQFRGLLRDTSSRSLLLPTFIRVVILLWWLQGDNVTKIQLCHWTANSLHLSSGASLWMQSLSSMVKRGMSNCWISTQVGGWDMKSDSWSLVRSDRFFEKGLCCCFQL